MPKQIPHAPIEFTPRVEKLIRRLDIDNLVTANAALAQAEKEIDRLQKQNALRGLYLVTIYEILFPDGVTCDEETEHRVVCSRIRELLKTERQYDAITWQARVAVSGRCDKCSDAD